MSSALCNGDGMALRTNKLSEDDVLALVIGGGCVLGFLLMALFGASLLIGGIIGVWKFIWWAL